MRWTIPNILTVVRLLAAPGVMLVFLALPRPLADWIAFLLFVGAAATDWVDGYIARAWNQGTKLGTMLDPIADKAMVMIALAVLVGLMGMSFWLAVPVALILFREVFVSGLREFLGDTAGTLKVTKLAKWKTTVQMVAISVLFVAGGLGVGEEGGLSFFASAVNFVGLVLLWIAGVLTLITGWDYFTKALPHLKEET